MISHNETYLPLLQWQTIAKQHRERALRWTEPCRQRKSRRIKHPILDFLFVYYPFSPGRLEQWHPGLHVNLEPSSTLPQTLRGKHYQINEQGVSLNPTSLNDKEQTRLKRIHNLLTLTQQRKANYSCFGMHEWAMVYRGSDIRHRESVPLRLSQKEIDHIVESRPLCCSHFDAVRFFAPEALPLNKLKPTLEDREQFEQPACLHSNMDLYKWASKCMPWLGSELLWNCFQLALNARELDMRASAYDLDEYGYTPVPVETPDGRLEYERQQRKIAADAQPLRQQIIDTLATVLSLANNQVPPSRDKANNPAPDLTRFIHP
ncbi:3-methyladenine DNA glycosylase [Verrucomicrobiaceae bacterium N1E253]|uniref:3-methyladenine DNA glycosylase n=1 Tax=Oceaniferula marina TaxID=2748318 RepID=A0A851GBN6_9BACT|nr:3-methyladenine DNA glycosylase [Oceaniferula marina]NWK54589.1 3-methyladenine DNA glycosylase [Oceaniferula marina]